MLKENKIEVKFRVINIPVCMYYLILRRFIKILMVANNSIIQQFLKLMKVIVGHFYDKEGSIFPTEKNI